MLDEDVDDFLSHFGVRGMKWGHRRGSAAGSRNTTFDKKGTSTLSDKEIHRRIQRMELERHYSSLNTPERSEGSAFVRSLMSSSGTAVVTAALGAGAGFFVQRALRQRFGG